jgi:hypothetical protein
LTILNLEWSSFPSRDRESSTLVCNYLRLQNFNVIEGCIFNAFYLILKHKPNALYMSNIVGARINFLVAKYAYTLGIPVFTSHAEGDFAEENITEFVWGHNYDKELIESKIFFWSKKNASLSTKYFKDITDKIYITGSPGHDKYIINKNENIKNFDRVNILCFDFSFTCITHSNFKLFSNETIEFFREQMVQFDEILYKTIKNNPNLKFYIKEHPSSVLGLKYSAVEKCSNLPNAYLVDKNISILDFLKSSNICISYQSNTSLESWLLGNISITLNPKTVTWPKDVYRTPFHDGQFIANSFNELNNLLKNIRTVKFSNIQTTNQNNLIKNIIGYADGLNHVRIGNYIIENIKTNNFNKNIKFDLFLFKNQILWFIKNLISFYRKKSYTITKMLEWNNKKLIDYQLIIFNKQIDFYKIINHDKASLLEVNGELFKDHETSDNISHHHIDFI